ncbi:MAG: hypothetical protein ACLRQX_06910 [Turicibacter sanguinis]
MSIKFFASKGTYIDRKLRPTSMATPNYLIEENITMSLIIEMEVRSR